MDEGIAPVIGLGHAGEPPAPCEAAAIAQLLPALPSATMKGSYGKNRLGIKV